MREDARKYDDWHGVASKPPAMRWGMPVYTSGPRMKDDRLLQDRPKGKEIEPAGDSLASLDFSRLLAN